MKTIMSVLVIGVLIGGVYLLVSGQRTLVGPPAVEDGPAIAWESTVVAESEFGMPESAVSVSIGGTEVDLGTASGTCADSTLPLREGQLSSYLCWWAGAGTEYGVFSEADGLVIRKGAVEEGGPDYEGFRGDFETIRTLP